MPKELKYTKINDKKYVLDTVMKVSGYDCRIQVPAKVGKTVGKEKRIKVTIEVLED